MKYIRIILIAVVLTGTCKLAVAQQTAGRDSIAVKKKDTEHSPRKATLYSAVLPGLGQVYNKKYWKVPLVYGGFLGFGIAIDWNNDRYIMYKQAHYDITDNDPKTNSFLDLPNGSFNLNNPSDVREFANKIKVAKDGHRRYRDMNIIFTVAFYALNIIDASVDAHFFNFDISDDLSMVWTPQTLYCLDQRMVGLNCRITF